MVPLIGSVWGGLWGGASVCGGLCGGTVGGGLCGIPEKGRPRQGRGGGPEGLSLSLVALSSSPSLRQALVVG